MADQIKALEQLRAAAVACKGWSWPDRRRDENGTHHFGERKEGEFYDIGTIDAWTYTSDYADDIRVLKFIRAAQPETVLALFSEIDRLRAPLQAQQGDALDAARWRHTIDSVQFFQNRAWAPSYDVHDDLSYITSKEHAQKLVLSKVDAAMLAARREG